MLCGEPRWPRGESTAAQARQPSGKSGVQRLLPPFRRPDSSAHAVPRLRNTQARCRLALHLGNHVTWGNLAERGGFEPPVPSRVQRFSSSKGDHRGVYR
jgi:hypothetical protein